MKVCSNNDWDPLREIVVGRADGARVPTVDASTMSFSYAGHSVDEVKKLEGQMPQWLIDEANADIERLVAVLVSHGVKVQRPLPIDTSQEFVTPQWRSTGWYT